MEAAGAHPKLRARVYLPAPFWQASRAITPRAQQLFEESLETCVELHDNHGVAVALNALAVNARDRGELAMGSCCLSDVSRYGETLGGPADIARALSNLANVIKLQGEYARASRFTASAWRCSARPEMAQVSPGR